MKIATLSNITRKEDLQIQASTQLLGFTITSDGDWFNFPDMSGNVFIRLRIVSHKAGTVQVIDRMPLSVLFELRGLKFGFFELSDFGSSQPGVNNGRRYRYSGVITVGIDGALELQDGEYLSLDLDCETPFDAEISTIDSPDLVSKYQRVNPQSVQGITREINLTDVKGILVQPHRVLDMQVQYEKRGVPVTQAEMKLLAQANNEVVLMDYVAKRSRAGYVEHVHYDCDRAQSATVTPVDAQQFYIYTVLEKTL
jgi:hypothetical protein